MIYFKTDIKKLFQNKIVQILFFVLLAVMILDPLFVYWESAKEPLMLSGIGRNPYNFVILMNSADIGGQVYNTLFYIFPVLITGRIYYCEQSTSVCNLLIARKNRRGYIAAKLASAFLFVFLFFLILLLINIAVTYTVFPSDEAILEQYIPREGSLAYEWFRYDPMMMMAAYALFNALAIAVFAVFSLELQMIVKFSNQYLAMIVPVVCIYAVMFILDSCVPFMKYDLNIVIQPATAYAITEIIKGKSYVIAFGIWLVIDLVMCGIAGVRNRDLL